MCGREHSTLLSVFTCVGFLCFAAAWTLALFHRGAAERLPYYAAHKTVLYRAAFALNM